MDCSQSSIFPEDGPDRGLCVMGCILHECQNYLGGYNPRGPLPPYIWKSRWSPLTIRRAISRRSHEKIGDCEQSSVSICFSILLNWINHVSHSDLTERVDKLTSSFSATKLFEISYWFGEIVCLPAQSVCNNFIRRSTKGFSLFCLPWDKRFPFFISPNELNDTTDNSISKGHRGHIV